MPEHTQGIGAMPFRFLMMLLSMLMFTSDAGGNGGDSDDNDNDDAGESDGDAHRDDADDESLGDAGKQALSAERKARKDAEKRAKDVQTELDAINAKAAKAKADEAKEQGKWEELATTREAELAEATTKLTGATDELESLRTYVTADLESVAKTVKDAAKDNPAAKILMEFHPGDEATTAELIAWTKRAKAQLPSLSAKETPRGNGHDPKPGSTGINADEAMAQARRAVPKL